MLKPIDNFLNRITMYRLVLYSLIVLLAGAATLSLFGILSYGFFPIIFSALFLTAVCWLGNRLFCAVFRTHANLESVYITALILALIITPAKTGNDYLFLLTAGILAMASKFVLAIGKKHIFNPAAIAVVITSFALGQSASWWVGTASMLPLVLITGFLIVRKIQRWDLVFGFFVAAALTCLTLGVFNGSSVTVIAKELLLDTPLFFLGFIMLTEPLTTPPTNNLQIAYGVLTGFLFSPLLHIGGIYSTPELALCIGNIFAYIVSPKQKLMLTLKQKIQKSPDIYDFIFQADKKIRFSAGQYLEWTLGHKNPDNRGNRRYFTLASSPTESEIILGVKFYRPPEMANKTRGASPVKKTGSHGASSFKKSLLAMLPGQTIMAGQLAGDFTLPKNKNQKLAFIAGGIGITPFRSMLKYLMDAKEKRDIIIFYASRSPEDVVYKEILDEAENRLGIKTIYTVTKNDGQNSWSGEIGYIDLAMIQNKVPDYRDRIFYVSGPKSMVDNFEAVLSQMGIKKSHVKSDFFPGFA